MRTPLFHSELIPRSESDYARLYSRSLQTPESFWAAAAREYTWSVPPTRAVGDVVRCLSYVYASLQAGFAETRVGLSYVYASLQLKLALQNLDSRRGPVRLSYFVDGRTNICHNSLDRHVGSSSRPAIVWEANDGSRRILSYDELLDQCARLATWLAQEGVQVGDAVGIYMPNAPEACVAMLACARIGAVHVVVFGGFSASALGSRLHASACKVLITASGHAHGPKVIPLKVIADDALRSAPGVTRVLVLDHVYGGVPREDVPMTPGRDAWWAESLVNQPPAPCTWLPAEAPLFVLYTSGSTGKPKGLLHTAASFMVVSGLMTQYMSGGLTGSDVFFCSADVGWITGTAYSCYGPLLNGATMVMAEGTPTYPRLTRWWDLIVDLNVTVFYTAATALRSLRAADPSGPRSPLPKLRVLGSVGEKLDAESYKWATEVVGRGPRDVPLTVVDGWGQTETAGICIIPCVSLGGAPPGSIGRPFYGVDAVILDGLGEGPLALGPYPGLARDVVGAGGRERYLSSYFSSPPGLYSAGDAARRDAAGWWTIVGRTDDVVNVAGHRLSLAEVEAALGGDDHVVEVACASVPNQLKGEAIAAFVVPRPGQAPEEDTAAAAALKTTVRNVIGPFAAPDVVVFLRPPCMIPKTRSGKVLRRALGAIAAGASASALGDLSTLADPDSLYALIAQFRGCASDRPPAKL